jgi:transglycosylase-like protein with SLT domain
MRSRIWTGGFWGAFIAVLLIPVHGYPASKKARSTAETVQQVIEGKARSVQLVTFPDTAWSPVKVVRGSLPAKSNAAPKMGAEKAETAEIVSFGDPQHSSVRVMRGETDHATLIQGQPRRVGGINMEMVSFTDPRDRPVSILRGSVSHMPDTELFGPASVADLDRVAFAVDGAESSHGADLRMWRPEPSGPQGPMQVTAAAAVDVGGGDRFDLAANRVLGRAYLAHMYRRYGNWPDAIAAYNWGPGNLDFWISGGRAADRFPLEVERYRDRVLRDAAIAQTGTTMLSGGWPFGASAIRAPSSDEPAPVGSLVDKAAVIDVVERVAVAGDTAIREIIAAARTRAADWRSTYSALGDRIIRLIAKHPPIPEEREAEYAIATEPPG